ncbi:flippase-like domain-containing protein [Natronosporangium hydrolyticum]|uniref:Flippase-like domain-containing protein n=1 Tax=Natronosporangium hydrolyticum TaxID=2811111 RepID=A0A895YBR1_9ACTN|nr:lysylphosphatidylglycerol synthase domain-containing protein [Natronosporangium hydrolyticum]QSB12893.1 flippase-like domain-containing protein [Natronosporangium hydrolyticum]
MTVPEPPVRQRDWRTAARRTLMITVLLVIAVAVTLALRGQDWSVLAAATEGREPIFFVLLVGGAFLANALAMLLAMTAWRAMLSGLGEPVGRIAAARIFFVGQFAKFVPGKVLGLVISVQMGRSIGVSPSRMMSAYLLTVVVILLTGATVGIAAGPELLGASTGWLVLAVLPVMAVLIRPHLIDLAAASAAHLLRRPAPATTGSGRGIRRAVVAQLAAWLLGGVQLWLLALVMGVPPARSLLLCIGGFSLATVAGMLAVFAPEGIGFREVVLLAALGVILPLPAAGVVVLASRLVTMLSEVAAAGAGLLVTEVHRRRGSRSWRQPLPAGRLRLSESYDEREQ